ncbi:MAG: hypothetical protein ABR998_11880 [Gemmatimonadales bacterium]|jgi:hypothetical protein
MRRPLLVLGLALLAVRGARAQAPPAGDTLAVVTVDTRRLGLTIPRDFIGYSLEVSTAGQGIGAFQGASTGTAAQSEQSVYALGRPGAPNEGYFHLMHNLGAGILRLGGNSQDNTCWDRAQAPHPDACQAGLDSTDLALWATAAHASGWKLIVGLNLKQNDPAWALREVTEGVARVIPRRDVLALEPGNEPDLFARTPYRTQPYTSADQAREFMAYARAFRANPVARRYGLAGPATCCGWRNPDDLNVFLNGTLWARLTWVTVHNYSATTCGGQTVSIAQLLSPELMDRVAGETSRLAATARAHRLKIAMAETNSASCGGMPGVSNAFASALWGLDYAFTLAQNGFVGVSFHTSYRPGGGSSYNPVDTYARRDSAGQWHYRDVAEPLYYALHLFAHHASGDRLLPDTVTTSRNVRSYATTPCVQCEVDVFVLNKDTSAAGPVRVHLARRMGEATLLLLSAPNLGSLAADISYAGRQFGSDGGIGAAQTVVVRPDAAGDYTFTLPNAAIALLTVWAKGRQP